MQQSNQSVNVHTLEIPHSLLQAIYASLNFALCQTRRREEISITRITFGFEFDHTCEWSVRNPIYGFRSCRWRLCFCSNKRLIVLSKWNRLVVLLLGCGWNIYQTKTRAPVTMGTTALPMSLWVSLRRMDIEFLAAQREWEATWILLVCFRFALNLFATVSNISHMGIFPNKGNSKQNLLNNSQSLSPNLWNLWHWWASHVGEENSWSGRQQQYILFNF